MSCTLNRFINLIRALPKRIFFAKFGIKFLEISASEFDGISAKNRSVKVKISQIRTQILKAAASKIRICARA